MKKYFLVSILLLLGTMLGTATAQTITGKVTDPSRQPIDGATVVLQTPDSIFVEATITNANGTFLLNHQPDTIVYCSNTCCMNRRRKKAQGLMPARLHCNRKTMPFRKSWYKANARWSP